MYKKNLFKRNNNNNNNNIEFKKNKNKVIKKRFQVIRNLLLN